MLGLRDMLRLTTTTLYGHPVWDADGIDDFEEFLAQRIRSSHVIFRGQNSSWPLLPYVSRVVRRDHIPKVEQQLRQTFMHESVPYVGNRPGNEWDWLALAQHHGVATRMLDWTRDPFIALWFAVRKPPKDAEYRPEVWVFDPRPRNIVSDKKNENPFDPSATKVFVPKPFHPRVEVQQAAFVVFKYLPYYPNGFRVLSKNNLLRRRLERIRFPHYRDRRIRTQLNRRGYSSFNLFPDLDKTCKKMMRDLKKWPNKPIQCTENSLRGLSTADW
jgi:hypothetical protein